MYVQWPGSCGHLYPSSVLPSVVNLLLLCSHRDAESDNTYLIGHENIRNSAIVSHTPADYDRADDTNFENTKEDAINFENPLYGAGVDKDEFEDMKQDLGSDSCSDSNSDAM